eukprot:TRINITY_DN27617_c0_g1_i1.p1 TRINITY_DN27617_c0_g1~~TRINITY_DN27617_c0_g1_i1.p1  ORF type:complete len:207 (-),score=50.21 TRINITY_DN27617_c0_g1_i1:30-650(-)
MAVKAERFEAHPSRDRLKIAVTDCSGNVDRLQRKGNTREVGSKLSTSTQVPKDGGSSFVDENYRPPQPKDGILSHDRTMEADFVQPAVGHGHGCEVMHAKGASGAHINDDHSSDDEDIYVPPQRQNAMLPCEDDDMASLETALRQLSEARVKGIVTSDVSDDYISNVDGDYVPTPRQYAIFLDEVEDLVGLETALEEDDVAPQCQG